VVLGTNLQHCRHDPVLVHRCLINLLCHVLNSCTAGAARIVVRTESTGDRAVITVSADGRELDAEALSKLRALIAERLDVQGIGLPTAAGLIREQNGRLEVESPGGRGTTYRLSLPLTGPPSPPRPGAPSR